MYIFWGVKLMGSLRTRKIVGNVPDTGTKFTIGNDSTCVEGNSGRILVSHKE